MFVTPGSRSGIKTPPRLAHGYVVRSHDNRTVASGTFRPDPRRRTIQHLVANGAFTFAPQTEESVVITEVLNGAGAGAITTSGYTKVDGNYATANGSKFLFISTKSRNFAHLNIIPLQ